MALNRKLKYRHIAAFCVQNRCYIITFFISLIFITIYSKEIYYYYYINTLNIQPYRTSITMWSSDFHISPIHDLKNLLIPMGVKFFDKSLSYSCSRTGTCYSPLRIITRGNGMNPSESIRQEFYEFYKDQIEMNVVDAFVCFHPASMCELYMPFNRSIIVIASTRYELSRFYPESWREWNKNLGKLSRDPKNVIAANNLYDAEYIRYFTGINPIVLPSFCNYTNSDYNPTRKEFLLSLSHDDKFNEIFKKFLDKSLDRYDREDVNIIPIRELYEDYQYSDLTNHPAIIHIPYQVSVMSLFEQYRMNIPLVYPSLDLLTEWHLEYGLVSEKTWDQALLGIKPGRSHIPGVLIDVPDPNNDLDRIAVKYWLNFSDFYQWPHITYFDSIDDLIEKLRSTNFPKISKKMRKYNKQVGNRLLNKWSKILNTIKKYSKKFQAFL